MNGPALENTENDILVTTQVFGMSFFFSGGPALWGADLIAVLDTWLDFAGRDRFGWYATESMNKHRKTNKKTFGVLSEWLAPGAVERDYIALTLKGSSTYNAAGAPFFQVFSNKHDAERGLPAYLHVAVPAAEAEAQLDALEQMFLSTCSRLPMVSAQGGWGLQTSPYFEDTSDGLAWAASMHYPGLDVFTGVYDRRAVGLDGLRSVNWLTAVGSALLPDLGGIEAIRKHLPPDVAIVPLSNGVQAFRAGSMPVLGDRSDQVAPYAALDRALRPLIDRCMPRAMQFTVRGNNTATSRWFRRFCSPE